MRQRDGIAIVDLRGEIGAEAQAALDAAYEEAVAGGARRVLLNFEAVDYINSTGIALIVGVLARGRSAGRTIVAYGLDDHYREIFTITRLTDFMALFPNEEAAVSDPPARGS